MPHRKRQTEILHLQAFTLAEVLVVLVILAILAAVIIPSAVGSSDLTAVSAAKMVAADLQYAQNEAITAQGDITVSFDAAAKTYELRNASQLLIHPMKHTDYVVNFGSQEGFDRLEIVSADFNGASEVTFDETGAPDNAGSVTLRVGSCVYRVDVAVATGKITVTAVGS